MAQENVPSAADLAALRAAAAQAAAEAAQAKAAAAQAALEAAEAAAVAAAASGHGGSATTPETSGVDDGAALGLPPTGNEPGIVASAGAMATGGVAADHHPQPTGDEPGPAASSGAAAGATGGIAAGSDDAGHHPQPTGDEPGSEAGAGARAAAGATGGVAVGSDDAGHHLRPTADEHGPEAGAGVAAGAGAADGATGGIATGSHDAGHHPQPTGDEPGPAASARAAASAGAAAGAGATGGVAVGSDDAGHHLRPTAEELGPEAGAGGTDDGDAARGNAVAGGVDAAPAPPSDTPELTGYAAQVAAGYAYAGGTLPLGALLEGEAGASPTPNAGAQVGFALTMLNRHGLVAGATGTGKTRTLQSMAEGLSLAGVPVFLADIKGDLSGLCVPGQADEAIASRAASIGQDWQAMRYPVEFYSLGGLGKGVPIRTTVTDFGPLLLSKVLGLNETQESSLGLVFHWADTQGLALLDLLDLQSTIAYLISDDGRQHLKGIGGLSAATAGVILREIVALQAQGADVFFGEPAFSTSDLLRVTPDGLGVISALELPAVQDRPAIFSTFLMWLLADLFQELPEVGDPDKPKLVFFFDEAHLLFTGASKDFLQQVTQTVRLIRSKGVGVFFVTQSPKDIPADVLAQLGNRVQHALRAYTPNDANALRQAVRTFPHSPYDLERLLQSLATGEAVVTVLTETGAPAPVAWTRVRAPQASMSPAPPATMDAIVAASPGQARYGAAVDNESAFELLQVRVQQEAAAREAAAAAEEQAKADAKAQADAARQREKAARDAEAEFEKMRRDLERTAAQQAAKQRSSRTTTTPGSRATQTPLDSIIRTAGTAVVRELTRSIFGTRRR